MAILALPRKYWYELDRVAGDRLHLERGPEARQARMSVSWTASVA